MSNFSKISKSVKKSLCVLASASSIFSILPTAMAMKKVGNSFFDQNLETNEKELIDYFVEHGIECAKNYIKILNNGKNLDELVECYEDSNKISKDFNIRITRDIEKLKQLYKKLFEEKHIANCRVSDIAVSLKANELNCKSLKECFLFTADENNNYVPGQSSIKHAFNVIELNNKCFIILDIIHFMWYYRKVNKKGIQIRCDLDEYIREMSEGWFKTSGIKYTHVSIDGEIYKKISYINGKFELEEPKSNEIVKFNK